MNIHNMIEMERNTRLTAKAECLFGKNNQTIAKRMLFIWFGLDTLITVIGISLTGDNVIEQNYFLNRIYVVLFMYDADNAVIDNPLLFGSIGIAITKLLFVGFCAYLVIRYWQYLENYATMLHLVNYSGLLIVALNITHLVVNVFG